MYHFLHKYFNTFCSTCRGWFHHYIRRQQLFLMQYFPRTVTGWCIQFEIQPPELLFNHYHVWLINVSVILQPIQTATDCQCLVENLKNLTDVTSIHVLVYFRNIYLGKRNAVLLLNNGMISLIKFFKCNSNWSGLSVRCTLKMCLIH